MKSLVTISPQADGYLADIFIKNPGCMLRVSLDNKGCSGHSYKWEFACEGVTDPGDLIVETSGGKLVIPLASQLYLAGSTLEIRSDQFGSELVWNNPNVVNQCGCGKSVGF